MFRKNKEVEVQVEIEVFYLLHVIINGVMANVTVKGDWAEWVAKAHKPNKSPITVVNVWPLTEEQYNHLQRAAEISRAAREGANDDD